MDKVTDLMTRVGGATATRRGFLGTMGKFVAVLIAGTTNLVLPEVKEVLAGYWCWCSQIGYYCCDMQANLDHCAFTWACRDNYLATFWVNCNPVFGCTPSCNGACTGPWQQCTKVLCPVTLYCGYCPDPC